jgi:hypothetical protein
MRTEARGDRPEAGLDVNPERSSFQSGLRRALTRERKPPTDDGPAARRNFFDQAGPVTQYLSVEAKGLTFLVATNDRLGRGLFVRRWIKDFRELDRAVRLLSERGLFRPGSTFVDVGANITDPRLVDRPRRSARVPPLTAKQYRGTTG